jgi:hypothetical protein
MENIVKGALEDSTASHATLLALPQVPVDFALHIPSSEGLAKGVEQNQV